MPYSMDPQANRENPTTPSPLMTLHEQLIYKLAALDASMQSGFRRLDEKMDRFQSDLHNSQLEVNDRINKLKSEMDATFLHKHNRIDTIEVSREAQCKTLQGQIDELKNWKTVLTTRMAMVGFGAFAVWAVIGQPIQNLFSRLLGT